MDDAENTLMLLFPALNKGIPQRIINVDIFHITLQFASSIITITGMVRQVKVTSKFSHWKPLLNMRFSSVCAMIWLHMWSCNHITGNHPIIRLPMWWGFYNLIYNTSSFLIILLHPVLHVFPPVVTLQVGHPGKKQKICRERDGDCLIMP